MHENDYPAGFGAGIVVAGSASVDILWATPFLPLPDAVPNPPVLIYGATQFLSNGVLDWVTGWWQVPLDPPKRYEPLGSGTQIFNSTMIVSVTQLTEILHSKTINTTIINASSVIASKSEWSFEGNNSYDIITLPTPAIDGTVELDAITSPHISHAVEWTDGNQWAAIKIPPLAGQSFYSIVGASPIIKWTPRTTYRFRFYEAKP
jgi:hypothetical protein